MSEIKVVYVENCKVRPAYADLLEMCTLLIPSPFGLSMVISTVISDPLSTLQIKLDYECDMGSNSYILRIELLKYLFEFEFIEASEMYKIGINKINIYEVYPIEPLISSKKFPEFENYHDALKLFGNHCLDKIIQYGSSPLIYCENDPHIITEELNKYATE